MIQSRAVLWYQLIKEMEEFRQQTGWGLAHTWGLVHKDRYDEARRAFDATKYFVLGDPLSRRGATA